MSISKKRLNEISNIKDENIDYSDIPELDDNFWINAKLEAPHKKQQVCLRLDPEVLQWFKTQGKGYQTQINMVLKSYVKAHK